MNCGWWCRCPRQCCATLIPPRRLRFGLAWRRALLSITLNRQGGGATLGFTPKRGQRSGRNVAHSRTPACNASVRSKGDTARSGRVNSEWVKQALQVFVVDPLVRPRGNGKQDGARQ